MCDRDPVRRGQESPIMSLIQSEGETVLGIFGRLRF